MLGGGGGWGGVINISSITMILGRYVDQSYSNILTEKHLCLRQHFLNEAIFSRSHVTQFMMFLKNSLLKIKKWSPGMTNNLIHNGDFFIKFSEKL